ncbi:MAG: M1 family aminopeptidase [Candidatus Nitrosocaldaceae archaeon]
MTKFELIGSKPHYAPLKPFTIKHMRLEIEPLFESSEIRCKEYLTISAIMDRVDKIILDAAELNIRSIKGRGNIDFKMLNDKLYIYIDALDSGRELTLEITYDAKPRRGLYFIKADESYKEKNIQVWTQGEATDSKYWFVTFDHPDIKFTSEIIAKVPKQFIAISNGKLIKSEEVDDKRVYHWLEENPHSAYITSLVIGEFVKIEEWYKGIELAYYIPKNRKDNAMLSFRNTKDMLEFFEEYTGTKYPYSKYSQVVVEDFIYGGMENINTTTLTMDTLHDEKASRDFTSDHLISHELAHQWFGDLVTCRDWQHIWLNEGFATYFEALYWEKSRGRDEFNYYMLQIAEEYFEEASKRYKRAIVTNIYKNPDELFDRHTYEKGACILHMIRKSIGDINFRKVIKSYIEKFRLKSVESDDFRRCIEEYGYSMQQFFDQWLRTPGHPELRVELNPDIPTIKIIQMQEDTIFTFPLDIKVFTINGKVYNYTIEVNSKETLFTFPLSIENEIKSKEFTLYPTTKHEEIAYISIDDENKILKKLDLNIPKQMLIELLKKGNIIERFYAANSIVRYTSSDVVDALKSVMMSNVFWGVAVECAKALGKIKSDDSYKALIEGLRIEHPKVRRAIVKSLGEFKKKESIDILVKILYNDNESYFVQAEAALAVGKIKEKSVLTHLTHALNMRSFNEIIASNALLGIAESKDDEMLEIIIEKSKYGEHHKIREAATLALSKYADKDKAYNRLVELLNDRWFKVRINAIKALEEAKIEKALSVLEDVANKDLEPRVRRVAEEAIISIKEYMKKPKEISMLEEEVDRLKSKEVDIERRLDVLERR